MNKREQYEPIENYGIIGNLETVALVSKTGAIDFMCYPRFDSPTVFAALLDKDKGGAFSINPVLKNIEYKQLYLPGTAILITRFLADTGIAEIIDFMPVQQKSKNNTIIIRRINTIRGIIKYKMQCKPRFNYGQNNHVAKKKSNDVLFKCPKEHATLQLSSSLEMEVIEGDASCEFTLGENESATFIFQTHESNTTGKSFSQAYAERCYKQTISFWQSWIEKCTYKGLWMETVNRSAITLKLLTSARYGSVIAAPTFGLPESIGGKRNWDYRYTWIRDASFTMYVFLQLGYIDEAKAFLSWIQKQCVKGQLQLMYAVDGTADLRETYIEYWNGYRGSKPIRIGNQAHEQFQLDAYGDLMDVVYLFNKYGGDITYEFWQQIQKQIDVVVERWREPDHGIWEIRSLKKEYLHSRLMCWVAIDRAIKIAELRSFPFPHNNWKKIRDEIYNDIYHGFWNENVSAFTQSKGSTAIDASALMMPLRRFISPYDTKWVKTMEAIDRELRMDVLIYRYNNELASIDGLKIQEGTFSICSFWYVECLAKGGQVDIAREYFEKMLGYTNHLGLYAEEIGLRGEQLGNYPQAFTHLGLISAALAIHDAQDKKKHGKVLKRRD